VCTLNDLWLLVVDLLAGTGDDDLPGHRPLRSTLAALRLPHGQDQSSGEYPLPFLAFQWTALDPAGFRPHLPEGEWMLWRNDRPCDLLRFEGERVMLIDTSREGPRLEGHRTLDHLEPDAVLLERLDDDDIKDLVKRMREASIARYLAG
jgi:hypothetical protein